MSNLNVTNVNGSDAEAGKAKAWANLDGTGTIAMRGSFNVSSVVDNGVGDYTTNLTNNFIDANYGWLTGAGAVNATADVTYVHSTGSVVTASSIRLEGHVNNIQTDLTYANLNLLGDLA